MIKVLKNDICVCNLLYLKKIKILVDESMF